MRDNKGNDHKKRLKKIIGKKFDTTMIFPLSEFEIEFGHLWGHGKPETELTEEEKKYRKKYNTCRDNILDNGNRQKKNAFTEINMYDVKWNRYNTIFIPFKGE